MPTGRIRLPRTRSFWTEVFPPLLCGLCAGATSIASAVHAPGGVTNLANSFWLLSQGGWMALATEQYVQKKQRKKNGN